MKIEFSKVIRESGDWIVEMSVDGSYVGCLTKIPGVEYPEWYTHEIRVGDFVIPDQDWGPDLAAAKAGIRECVRG